MDKHDEFLQAGKPPGTITLQDLLPTHAYTWHTCNVLAFKRAIVYLSDNNRQIKGRKDIPYIISLINIQYKAWIEAGQPDPESSFHNSTQVSVHDSTQTTLPDDGTDDWEQTTREVDTELPQIQASQAQETRDKTIGLVQQFIETVEDTTGQIIAGELTIRDSEETTLQQHNVTVLPNKGKERSETDDATTSDQEGEEHAGSATAQIVTEEGMAHNTAGSHEMHTTNAHGITPILKNVQSAESRTEVGEERNVTFAPSLPMQVK